MRSEIRPTRDCAGVVGSGSAVLRVYSIQQNCGERSARKAQGACIKTVVLRGLIDAKTVKAYARLGDPYRRKSVGVGNVEVLIQNLAKCAVACILWTRGQRIVMEFVEKLHGIANR